MRIVLIVLVVVALLTAGLALHISTEGESDPVPSIRTPVLNQPPIALIDRSVVDSSEPATGGLAPLARPPLEMPSVKEPASKPAIVDDAIPNEYVLSFYDLRDKEEFIKLAESRSIEIAGVSDFGNTVKIRTSDRQQFEGLLRDGPTPVDYSADYRTRIPVPEPDTARVPSGTYFGFGNSSLKWLGVDEAQANWGAGIKVAVLDTGVLSHPGIDETSVTRLDLLASDEGEGDSLGHATAVASIIVGRGPDVVGIASKSEILSIKVMSPDGEGDAFTLARGIIEAVDRGAQVVNISMGTHGDSYFLRSAIEHALEHGVAVVAAVGNDAVDGVSYPARYDGVLGVSAVDASRRHMYFANRGSEVDVAAPGYNVTVAWTNDMLASFSGTSVSVPFVSGAIAGLLSSDADMTVSDVLELIRKYSDDAGAPGEDDSYGSGILNVRRLVQRNQKGIYDVAVGPPHIPKSDNGVSVILYIQNRGTELIRTATLSVEIDGVATSVGLHDIAVGATVSREFELSRGSVQESGRASIRYAASVDGRDDPTPGNNAVDMIITWGNQQATPE